MVRWGKKASKYYCQNAEKLVEKRDEPYSVMMSWIRRKISFSMMKLIIMFIRGGRSIKHKQQKASYGVMNNLTPKAC